MTFPVSEHTASFIRSLPKTETHLHIEGALPFELLKRLDPANHKAPPAAWAAEYRYPDFSTFEWELIGLASQWYTAPERYRESAELVFSRLQSDQNVRYVETSFASGMVEFLKLDGRAVAEAIKSAAPEGLEVRVFLGIHHGGYHEGTRDWIEDSLNWPSLDGYDLHGPETDPLGPWAADFWDRARQAGKTTKAHAGEFDGPDFVRRCLDELGVHRIQHGVRSVEDPKLIERLAADGATLDVCPISNVKLGVVSSYDRHPMRSLLEAGIRCTVSTDDPMIFGNTLFDEYAMLSARGGLTHSELARIAANGFEAALVDESQRASWLVELSEATGRG